MQSALGGWLNRVAESRSTSLRGSEDRLCPLHFSCWVCSENYKLKLFGIVTIPSGNINYIEQNLFSLLKSQHKIVVN